MDRARSRTKRERPRHSAGEIGNVCEIFESHTVSAISRSAVRRHGGVRIRCTRCSDNLWLSTRLFVTRALRALPRTYVLFLSRCVRHPSRSPHFLLTHLSSLPLGPTAEIASAFSMQYIRRNTGGYPLTGHYCYL